MSQQISSLIEALESSLHALLDNADAETINTIENLINEGSVHQSPQWASHMTPDLEHTVLLGKLLAGFHNGNLLSAELYPQLATIEKQLIDWFCKRFGLPNGHFTHGSTYANLEALWQARDRANNPSKIVYGSEASHYSITKACHILGLEFQAISTDVNGKIDTDMLRHACQQQSPIAIVATAGTTSSGAIDSVEECIEISNEFNCWCHIDAAWGGALMLLDDHHFLKGIEDADSVCFDPHKTLGQPRPCSILLYQHTLSLMTDHEVGYLSQTPKQTLSGSYGAELFIPLWLSLAKGSHVFTEQIKQRLVQANTFAITLAKQSGWRIFHSPTGIVCFQTPSSVNLTALEEQGLISRSKINGQEVWRAVFISQTTSEALLSALAPYF